jgi:hypothetical protein
VRIARLATTIRRSRILVANKTHLCPSLVTSLFSVNFPKVLFNEHTSYVVNNQNGAPLFQSSVPRTHFDKHRLLALQNVPETQPHRIRRPCEGGTEPFLRSRTACSEVGFPRSVQGLRGVEECKRERRFRISMMVCEDALGLRGVTVQERTTA